MKPNAFLNGVSIQEFFPLIAKLAQQIKMPAVFIDLKTTGHAPADEIGITECHWLTVAPSGSVTKHSAKVEPDLAQLHKSTGSDFRSVYDGLTRSFASALIAGFKTSIIDVPAIYGNMVRYGLPIMAARNQLDIKDIWQKEVRFQCSLDEMAKHYGVDSQSANVRDDYALLSARLLEAMLWKHGSDAVLAHLQCTLSSYLTPEQVTGQNDPLQHLDAEAFDKSSSGPKRKTGSRNTGQTSPGSVRPTRRRGQPAGETWLGALKKSIEKIVERSGVVRPIHLAEIAADMDWSEAKTSIEIGRLLTQGRLKADPFVIPEQQELLKLHLRNVLAEQPKVKLKPIKEALLSTTGHEIEYIQIRLGLKAVGIRLEQN